MRATNQNQNKNENKNEQEQEQEDKHKHRHKHKHKKQKQKQKAVLTCAGRPPKMLRHDQLHIGKRRRRGHPQLLRGLEAGEPELEDERARARGGAGDGCHG